MIWITLLACGAPELEDAHDEAAAAYCDRAITCDWIPVAQEQECLDTMEPIFSSEWTIARCEDNIGRAAWKDCEDALGLMACDNEGWGIHNIPGECDESILCNG